MTGSAITIVTDRRLLDHDTGEGHPEVPERLLAIDRQLRAGPLADRIRWISPVSAAREWLQSFHSEEWLLRFEEQVLSGRSCIGHPDNQVCYETFAVAELSAGAGITGVDLVEQGGQGIVFCAVRPPGHHAEAGMPYGFCFLNNCVIAARYWQGKYGRRRLCVLDFDAHHGNGIQAAFENDEETLYISIHEHPSFSYPGTGLEEDDGTGPGAGTICNVPLLPGSEDRQVLREMDGRIARRFEDFLPDALIVAAGFDGHMLDDMSDLRYTTGLFGQLGERIGAWAGKYCGGRVLSILEGGYHLPSLGQSVESYLSGLKEGLRHGEESDHER